MDNMNTQTPEPKESNKKLIIISSIVIVALVAAFVIVGISLGWFGGNKKNNSKQDVTAPTIKVVETKGSEGKTAKIKVSVRDVKFGDSLKSVKKFEKKQQDTVNSPSEASTKDGYTYLTYTFNPKKAEFFGVKPAESTAGSLLQYVFKDKKLFDIRLQYGDISKKDQAKLRKNLVKKYGKSTFSTKYSNDSTRDLWRTYAKDASKQTILSLNYSPNSGVIIEYESVTR